jgi:hypothetical protein
LVNLPVEAEAPMINARSRRGQGRHFVPRDEVPRPQRMGRSSATGSPLRAITVVSPAVEYQRWYPDVSGKPVTAMIEPHIRANPPRGDYRSR